MPRNLIRTHYWTDLVAAELAAGGHGDQNSTDAGLISVVEVWAIHLGHTYAHRTYGPNSSNNLSWEGRLDQYWNETMNHIPGGLFHDLVDTGEPDDSFNEEDNGQTTVDDHVSGFTHFELYQTLSDKPYGIGAYQTDLGNRQPNWKGNAAADINDLFNSY